MERFAVIKQRFKLYICVISIKPLKEYNVHILRLLFSKWYDTENFLKDSKYRFLIVII